jgi:hypothetical protein
MEIGESRHLSRSIRIRKKEEKQEKEEKKRKPGKIARSGGKEQDR